MLMEAGWTSAKIEMLGCKLHDHTRVHGWSSSCLTQVASTPTALPESIDASRVFDSDRFAGVVDVAVLADPLVVASGLLLRDGSVFLSKGGSELAIAHVEPLLLQDPGEGGVALELGRGKGGGRQQGNLQRGQVKGQEGTRLF